MTRKNSDWLQAFDYQHHMRIGEFANAKGLAIGVVAKMMAAEEHMSEMAAKEVISRIVAERARKLA